MRKLLLLLLLPLWSCGESFDYVTEVQAQALTQEQELYNTCNNTTSTKWLEVFEVTADLNPSAPIECNRAVIIRGNGHTINGGLHFKAGASWSSLENLNFQGPDFYTGTEEEPVPHATGNSIGLLIEAHGVKVKNIKVQKYDVGVSVYGTATNATNANSELIEQGWISNNGIGLLIDGGDSNAGRFSDLETRNNTVHIWDSSFLGNVHIGGISDGYGVYRRHDSAAGYSTLLGVYIEGDPPLTTALDFKGYNLVVGGNLSIWSTSTDLVGSVQNTVSPHGFSRLGFSSHNRDMRVTIPAGDHAAFTFSHRDEGYNSWHAFRFLGGGQQHWSLAAYLNSSPAPLRWNGRYTGLGAIGKGWLYGDLVP